MLIRQSKETFFHHIRKLKIRLLMMKGALLTDFSSIGSTAGKALISCIEERGKRSLEKKLS